jgi:hypothetical protein
MMLIWWVFRCDDNHRWEVLHDESDEFPTSLEGCPVDGAPAVTLQKMAPADRVRVSIVPAARVGDAVTGALENDTKFVLEITPWQEGRSLRSNTLYEWSDAVERAAWFRGLSWDEAVQRWERSGLGDPNTTRFDT